MKLGVACDGWEIKSSDEIEEVAKLQCEPVEHEGCSVCDPLEINTGIPCYKTVFVEELPEAGISGILYVTKTDDEYSIYEWDGSIFVNVTSPVSCTLQTKTVTPAASQVEYLPDSGYDGFDKVTVEAIPSEYVVPSGTKNITANGTHDVTDYASAAVNVPASAVDSGTKNITSNGNGQDVVGYAAVNVNVPNSYSASDEGKVVQSGALVSQSSQNITENGTYDTTLKNEVVVNVSGGGGITTDELALNAKPTGVVTLGSSVAQIKDYAFAGKPITSISGASVTTIGVNALINTQVTEITDAMFPSLGVGTIYIVFLRIPTMTSIALSGRKIVLSSGSYALRDNKALVYARFPNAARDVGASYKGCGAYAFGGCKELVLADLGFVNAILPNAFNGATKISTIILRNTSVVSLANVSAFSGSPFKSGGTGGTIYIPKVLYDQLGTGTNDYKAASNWATINGYGTITWAAIEGSEYE